MSSGPETRFIKGVHDVLHPDVYRMKNHNPYVGGIPDCWYSCRRDLWIEYKFRALPKRPDTVVDLCAGRDPMLSVLQQEWLRDRHAEGRTTGVIVGTPDGGVWLPKTLWARPWKSGELKERLQSKRDLAQVIESVVGFR